MVLLGAMLAVVALVLLRPGMLVKPTPDFSLLEEMAEELMGRIEEREAELDQKYQAILEPSTRGTAPAAPLGRCGQSL